MYDVALGPVGRDAVPTNRIPTGSARRRYMSGISARLGYMAGI